MSETLRLALPRAIEAFHVRGLYVVRQGWTVTATSRAGHEAWGDHPSDIYNGLTTDELVDALVPIIDRHVAPRGC